MDAQAFKSRFPEFEGVTDDRITLAIEDAGLEVDSGKWGALYTKGVAHLAAHFLALDAAEPERGVAPLSAMTVDGVSMTYDTSKNPNDPLAATRYGQEFIRLRRKIGAGGLVITG